MDLTVIDPKSSNLHLLGLIDLSSHGILFNPNTKTYTFKLDETYINEEIIINVLKGFSAQEISGPVNAPLTLNHGINRYEIFVKAEDSTVTQGKYTIIIEVRYKTNELKTLTVDGKLITVKDSINIATEKESVNIAPILAMPSFGRFEIKDSLGKIVTNNPNLKVGNNLFTIDIINEYGEITKTHALEITRNESSEKSITNVTLIGK